MRNEADAQRRKTRLAFFDANGELVLELEVERLPEKSHTVGRGGQNSLNQKLKRVDAQIKVRNFKF